MSVQLNAVTGSGSVTIQQRVAKLYFTMVVAATTNAATALAAVSSIVIEIKRKDNNGERPVFPSGSLLNTLESHTQIQSAINVTNDGTDTTVTGSLLLTKGGGSMNFNENQKLVVDVSGIPVGTSLSMNSLAFPGDASFGYSRDYVGTLDGVKTPMNVEDAEFIAVPRSALTKIELEYPGGKTEIFEAREVYDLSDEHRQAAYVKNGLVTPGGERMGVLNTDHARKAYVTTSGLSKVELVKVYPI